MKACRRAQYTRQDASKSNYCPVHAYVDTPDLEYVTCPLEPKNRFPKHQLEHHITVCPKALELRKIQAQPFFKKGINFFSQGEAAQQVEEEKKDSVDSNSFGALIQAAYDKLKLKYGAVAAFAELFTVDEQVDMWDRLNAEGDVAANKLFSESLKHGN